jgi:hypothetical protein
LQRNVRPNGAAAQASTGHFVVMSAGQMRQKTDAAAGLRWHGVFCGVSSGVFCFNRSER